VVRFGAGGVRRASQLRERRTELLGGERDAEAACFEASLGGGLERQQASGRECEGDPDGVDRELDPMVSEAEKSILGIEQRLLPAVDACARGLVNHGSNLQTWSDRPRKLPTWERSRDLLERRSI
jgi:hypothetical protein